MLVVVFGLIVMFLAILAWSNFDYVIVGMLSMLLIIFGFLLVLGGIFLPFNGYQKATVVSKTNLVSLSNSTQSVGHGGLFYASVDAENIYSYRYEVADSIYNTDKEKKTYVLDTIEGDVFELEDPNCKQATLTEYHYKPNKSKWYIAFCLAGKTEYVFHVPEGTIVKEITLK